MLASTAMSWAQPVAARDPTRAARDEGTIVRIDGDNLVVDVTDAMPGSVYRVFRPITVRHPVTQRVLRDRFPIGAVTLTHVGEALSTARAPEALERAPQVGDILVPVDAAPRSVRLVTTPVAPVAAAPTAPMAAPRVTPPPREVPPPPPPDGHVTAPEAPGLSAEERTLAQLVTGMLGQPPETRVRLYRDFLRSHPRSPRRAALEQEIAGMESIARAETPAPPPTPAAPTGPELLRGEVPTLVAGEPAVVALQLARRSEFTGALLHVRHIDEARFVTRRLDVQGERYLRGRVPDEYVVPDGFEYCVELVRRDGATVPVIGTPAEPVRVSVTPRPAPVRAVSGLTRVDVRAEFADVGSRTNRNGVFRRQQFVLVEGEFFQRLRVPALYGYRVGFGVYTGEGTPLADLDAATPAHVATVIYGYHELEFAFSDFVHAMVRGQIGVFADGLVGGVQLRLRVGNERRTNVAFGGEVLSEVGQRAFFAFNFAPLERLPMMAQGEVFHQTVASGDPMFRFIAQVGYRITPWWTLSARGSYQLRNIQNGGFGGGLSMTFDW
jgi:hypothetical protein